MRHYTYGGDLARGIVTAMEHPDALNDDFNLSTADVDDGARARRADLAQDPRRPTCRSGTCPTTPFEHDVQRRVPSVEKAKRVLGFEATTTLDEMLDVVIPWDRGAIDQGRI